MYNKQFVLSFFGLLFFLCSRALSADQLLHATLPKDSLLLGDLRIGSCHDFSEGLAAIKVDGQYGYIDKSGKMVIKPQFWEAADFSEGKALVRFLGKPGFNFIDKTGKIRINLP